MQIELVALILAAITGLSSFVYVKYATAQNSDDIKKIRDVELPTAIKNLKDLYERDHESMEKRMERRDDALWNKLDSIQNTQKDISKSLHRLEGKHGITE